MKVHFSVHAHNRCLLENTNRLSENSCVMGVLIHIQQAQKCTKMPWTQLQFFLALLFSFSKTMKSCITSSYAESISIWNYWCNRDITQMDVEDVYRYNQLYKYCSLKNYEKQPVKFMFLTVVVVYRDCILSGSRYLIKKQQIFLFFKGYSSHSFHAKPLSTFQEQI